MIVQQQLLVTTMIILLYLELRNKKKNIEL